MVAGTYQVTISAHGFASAQYSGIHPGISGTVTINTILKVAGAKSEIMVTDTPPLVQSSSAEIGMFLDSSTLSAMPLGRHSHPA